MFAQVLLIQGGFWDILLHMSTFAWIVILILLAMSLGSWGIAFNKWKLFKSIEGENRRFLNAFRRRRSLGEFSATATSFRRTPLARLFIEALKEYQKLMEVRAEANPNDPIVLNRIQLDAIDMTLERETYCQIGQLERNVAFLATTGNVAPFFGLLGTCWGIMTAFYNIGIQGSASLVVVAPGIAEALIATIFGLGVAIPAVIGYNWCNTKLKFVSDDLNAFSLEFMAVVSREQG